MPEGEDRRAHGARRHLERFGVLYAIALAWVVVAMALPSEPRLAASVRGPATPGLAAGPGAVDAPGGVGTPDQPTGSTPGAVTVSTVAPIAPPAVGKGTSRGGVDCSTGAPQMPGNSYSPPCIGAFTGDNGGATARGVTATTIRIVRRGFPRSANDQAIEQVNEQAGGASLATTNAARDTLNGYFGQMYELYGRKIEWVDYESKFGDKTVETQGGGREGACLDAEVIANELNAFGVTGSEGSVSKPFSECAAQRGLVVFLGADYASDTFYEKYHPYIWALTMDCERITYQVYEYFGKRLYRKPAKYAGDPAFQSKERVFGTYTGKDDGSGDTTCSDIATKEAAKLGVDRGAFSTYNYTLDLSRLPDEAARGIIQFKRDGVTSVVLACDGLSGIFLTQSASGQNFRPEWLVIGIALTDIDNVVRLYDEDQVEGHMFGLSQLGATPALLGPGSEAAQIYKKITGKTLHPGTAARFHDLAFVYNLLQAAGPVLNPAAIGTGARALPVLGAPSYAVGRWSFSSAPDGTPGGGDHTAIDDSREIYWMGDARSPADGKAGTFFTTYGGKRFTNGEWPAEDPPVYPPR